MNETIKVAFSEIDSKDDERSCMAAVSIVNSYILLKQDNKAKVFADKMITHPLNNVIRKTFEDFNFEVFKQETWSYVTEMQKKLEK